MVTEFHVLNLGVGVQSTTLYELFREEKIIINGRIVKLDAAIFADTRDEPKAVYRHLENLKKRNGPPILVRSKGQLSADLMRGENSTGQRFASIPAYTLIDGVVRNVRELEAEQQMALIDGCELDDDEEIVNEKGQTRRQCSKEYKIDVIEKTIREEIIGVRPRQRVPKGVIVHQYIGISLDESGRAVRIRANQKHKWCRVHFPLIEQFFWTRPTCKEYLSFRYDYEIPRSACVHCPFHDDNEWLVIKSEEEDWQLAVDVDTALRTPGTIVNRNMNGKMYLHRSCQPLVNIDFKPNADPRAKQLPMNFNRECMGVCGI